eukprot:gene18146-18428_t
MASGKSFLADVVRVRFLFAPPPHLTSPPRAGSGGALVFGWMSMKLSYHIDYVYL